MVHENTPPKINKYDDNHKDPQKWCLLELAHLLKKLRKFICQELS